MDTIRKTAQTILMIAIGMAATLSFAAIAYADNADAPDRLAIAELAVQAGNIEDASVYVYNADYTGSAVKPEYEVENIYTDEPLTEGVDYTISFSNNINVGTANYTVKGMGKYSGTETGTFRILQRYISDADVKATPISPVTYNGKAHTPTITLKIGSYTLVKDKDYLVTYDSNIKAGNYASVKITGLGSFEGVRYEDFVIKPASISNATFTFPAQYYNGGESLTPKPTVAKFGSLNLTEFDDYSVTYTNNAKPGTANAIISGTGNYTGTKTVTFTINKSSVANATVTGLMPYTYTGKKITQYPSVKVRDWYLKQGTDYTISYKNNKKAGTASLIITGKGGYTGKKTVKFKIKKEKIQYCSIDLPYIKYYTGKPIKPSPKVTFNNKKLKKGKDYTVSYKNNVNKGEATVIIKGKGNFTGSAKDTFSIM